MRCCLCLGFCPGVRDGDSYLLQANLGLLEANFEYMHQSVLISRVHRLVVELNSPRPEEVDSTLLWQEVSWPWLNVTGEYTRKFNLMRNACVMDRMILQ